MIPLYSQQEYDDAKVMDKLKCECMQCKKEFLKRKGDIQKVLRNASGFNGNFCSQKCFGLAKTTLKLVNCMFCNTTIQRRNSAKTYFCNHSCSAKFNNRFKKRKIKVEKSKFSKHEQTLIKFNSGLMTRRYTIRKCLVEIVGNYCNICKQPAIWQDRPITLVVDHIDGDASNNLPSNLRLLCPNCNSQTPTFCGRNFGKGRQSRGLPKH